MMTSFKTAILIMTSVLTTQSAEQPVQIFLAGDSTMSIKDPDSFPETGWGMPFATFFDTTAEVVNKAKNGRSSKSFQVEGRWDEIMEEVRPGDYVFIQFGHNDESVSKGERYTTMEEYKANLSKFVSDTRAHDAHPVLLTPVGRRKFDDAGIAVETHAERAPIVREIARELNVPLIDADRLSLALYQELGSDASRLLFLQLKPGEHPNYPDGVEDNTHFNELGARMIAELVLAEVRQQLPALATHIIQPQ